MTTIEASAVSRPTFRDFAREIAIGFLQTVVVVDNEAELHSEELISDLTPPSPRGGATEIEDESTEIDHGTSVGGRQRAVLDAKVLNESFARVGLVCSVLRPAEQEDLSPLTVTVARRADIVVLDWKLFDNGERACSIIRQIHSDDELRQERLRLIAIYTAESGLADIREAVRRTLLEVSHAEGIETDDNGGRVALKMGHMRIVFLEKGSPSNVNTNRFDEPTLPSRLVDEFSILAFGLLPTTVLAAISAVREETHRLLARFHSDLDGASLSHRFLIPTADDASQFIMQLIADEVSAVLEVHQIGATVVGFGAIKLYLDMLREEGRTFQLPPKAGQPAKPFAFESLLALAEHGCNALEGGTGGKKDTLYQRVPELLYRSLQEGIERHCEFARISSLRREAAQQKRFPPAWRPQLTQGSIIEVNGSYLVCIQPLCDAVRLQASRPFLFARLSVVEEKFDIIVRTSAGTDVRLAADLRPYQLIAMSFRPSEGAHFPVADKDADGNFAFRPDGDSAKPARWIADLREAHAMRLIQRVASRLSRVGLDEFEWQRKQAGADD